MLSLLRSSLLILTMATAAVQYSNATVAVPHPYYPTTIQLPHYVKNETSVPSLITQFGLLWAVVLVAAFIIIQHARPTASRSDRIAFAWMCLSKY